MRPITANMAIDYILARRVRSQRSEMQQLQHSERPSSVQQLLRSSSQPSSMQHSERPSSVQQLLRPSSQPSSMQLRRPSSVQQLVGPSTRLAHRLEAERQRRLCAHPCATSGRPRPVVAGVTSRRATENTDSGIHPPQLAPGPRWVERRVPWWITKDSLPDRWASTPL